MTLLRADLSADCSRCVGLCCVALAFARSSDFAMDKAAGEPCTHLEDDFRCEIHTELRPRGFKGCTVFDCFGAGQRVTQGQFAGRSWRADPVVGADMFAVFPIVRQLHELLWYLDEAGRLTTEATLRHRIAEAGVDIEAAADGAPSELLELDVAALRAGVGALLAEASEEARTKAAIARAAVPPRNVKAGADLVGAALNGQDLRGLSLRGALLIAADLRDADLRSVDLLGTDLRDAVLGGADLTTALFLTQSQLEAADGDSATRIPDALRRPAHWS